MSTIQQDKEQSSYFSSDSNISDIIRRKIHITIEKKKIEERNLPITVSIPFNLTMSDFDTEMTYVVDAWLGAMSTTSKIRIMLIDNEIKTYNDFKCLNKEEIYLLEQVKTSRATARLKVTTHKESMALENTSHLWKKVVIWYWLVTQLLGLSAI